jgi:hypothetical protein
MALTLTDFLSRVGNEHLKMQPLHPAITNIRSVGKSGSHVTFYTQELSPGDLAVDHPRQIGFVVWMPYDRYLEVQQAINESEKT